MFLFLLLPFLTSPALSQDNEEYRFTYDRAENLLLRTVVRDGRVLEEAMPLDGSGRNRPASVGGVPLEWDAAGNLTRKGGLHLSYDARHRLTVVRDPQGQELARYVYDAFNRRIEQRVGGEVVRAVWNELSPVETSVDGTPRTRRIYGAGIDEIVRIERDTNVDGVFDEIYVPVYDRSGNLVVVTDGTGKPVERYSYAPNGRRKIYTDLTAPRVEQVRVVAGALWVEVSEMVSTEALAAALTSGQLRLETAGGSLPLTLEGALVHARRHRVVLGLAEPPLPGDSVTLHFEPEALQDSFLNPLAEPVRVTFPWPEGDAVVFDTSAPTVYEIAYRNAVLEVELTEEIDLETAMPAIQVAGYVTSWTESADGYRLIASAAVPEGTHDLLITQDLTDLAGTALVEPFHLQLHVYPQTPFWLAYRVPDPRVTPESTIANEFGFQGLPEDPVTGFLYVRNRYYDPELARFITPDPMGYVDGPNMYQFALNNPVSFTDPLGLTSRTDIEQGTLFYTWHLGWVDLSHVQTRVLDGAWRMLRSARPGEVVTFTISLAQGGGGNPVKKLLTYKKSSATFRITAAEDVETRRRQLLWAWMELSEQFERYQGTGIQGSQWVNSLGGRFTGEEEKIGSSFSTEDLVSNLLGFYATVEGLRWDEVIRLLGGRLGAEEQEFSFLVWDCTDSGVEMGGNHSWQPKYLELKPAKKGCELQHDRLVQLYWKYLRTFGKPTFPAELQIEPERQGVEILSQENQ